MELTGSVILYNPDSDVLENIRSYIEEVAILYVIDNSEEKSVDLLQRIEKLSPKCKLLINPGNFGVAKALNQAVEIASSEGYDWLLTMNQDSRFEDNSYFKAFQEFQNKENVALFAPDIFISQDEQCNTSMINFRPIDEMVITSGNIINLNICNQVGGFEDKLFIDEVDTDYCFKLLKNKYSIIRIEGTFLHHNLGYINKMHFPFRIEKQLVRHHPLRHYYISRNSFYIFKKYIWYLPEITIRRWVNAFAIKTIIGILSHRNRWKIIKYTLLGISDFVINRYWAFRQKLMN